MIRSRVYLPKVDSPPATILEHLTQRFPHIPEATWRDRIARGLVTVDNEKLQEDSPYTYGKMVFYSREVPSEPAAEGSEAILYQDEEILIADKPHGMTVTPIGTYVARSLQHRLQERTAIETLTPLHRLDKDTAGLVMFSIQPKSRAAYHELFAKNAIQREYRAASRSDNLGSKMAWHVENRIGPGSPFYLQRIIDGPANAITDIELIEVSNEVAVFRLHPQTGKKHQLRLHMASIGFPILGDILYGRSRENPSELPLQLLAHRLSFIDPHSSRHQTFESKRTLQS